MSVGRSPKKILVLGGGDGLAIREILKFPSVTEIDLVDIDPKMTELSQRIAPILALNHNSLTDPKVTMHHEDAFNFVQRSYAKLEPKSDWYDRIIIDLPDPHSESLNKLYSKEFYGLLGRILSDDGAMVTQSGSPFLTREAFWCIAKTIETSGFQVLSYQTQLNSFGEWGFQLAIKKNNSLHLSSLALTPAPRRYLSDDVFQRSQVFSMDNSRLESPVNSIFEPKLYLLYEAGLSR
jgi:spermidine synthase